ncbi:hypothetical protein GQ53DRAFT_786223 [Thozetella sp. PMI_491]|nr:hypothetical protein GQ53DRAFT_786223 [Thozetella sp. PMI_491]
MSGQRPNFIDLRSQSQASISKPLRSPRLHVAGEAPPEFSPLDAFAHQSRLLARQLQESATKQGRRMSRLPPLTTESPLVVQGRSDYFRSMSQDSGSDLDQSPSAQHHMGLGLSPAVENDISNRPKSMHPRMSRIPPTPDDMIPLPNRQLADAARGRPLTDVEEGDDSFFGVDARREQSPGPLETFFPVEKQSDLRSATYDTLSVPSPTTSAPMFGSPEKIPQKKNSFDSAGLLPPRQLFPKRSSSIMSSPLESTDGEGLSSMGAFGLSHGANALRKLSTSSGLASPGFPPYQRSPSISSEASGLPRPSFNFSRPLSRAGTPSLDPPVRQASSDSQASFILADEAACTPISMNGEGFPDGLPEDGSAAAPSYIYSKFSLPRGKVLQRNSVIFADSHPAAQSQWEQQPFVPPSNAQPFAMGGQAPPSPPTRPASAGSRIFEEPIPRPSLERSKLSTEVLRPAQQPSPDPSRPSTEESRQSEDVPRGRPLTSPVHDAMKSKTALSINTSDSASTIKAHSQHSTAPTMHDISLEEHVSKAVALHEKGSLNESTYHLRHAARQGHPTGMLLYALACRHGWGMRPNQREGVEWLRKAVESASIEIADEEEHAKEGKSIDRAEQKTRKAQLALSVYELGVSHMNGWGIVQDKALALRCFEIAGSWGDVDALAEAGFCYAQGVGCKKNLKKSAQFYRQAEAKGMSMVGNSWIYKSKYDDSTSGSPKSEKKTRSKSRTRKGLFGKKNAS